MGLNKIGFSPNSLSLIGFIINLECGYSFARGNFILAGTLILFGGIFDLMDGELARVTEKITQFGAFLDSCLDRYSDSAILVGLLWYYANKGELTYVMLAAVTLVGFIQVSYTKARAEGLMKGSFSGGLMERAERLIVLAIGAFCGNMECSLWILAPLTHFTAIYRIAYTKKVSNRSDPP